MKLKHTLALAGAATGLALAVNEVRARRREAKTNLTNKVVLITGGSRGLGLALARELAGQGCRLALCSRSVPELEAAQADLSSRGAEALTVLCDVTDRAAVERMVDTVIRHYGGLDILINNAAILTLGPMETMTIEDYEAAMNVAFWGMVYTTLAALPHMRTRRSGHIVNVTSIGGKVATPHLLPYTCAKFAATGFSEGLHMELSGSGISVTTVVPGFMRTGSYLNVPIKGPKSQQDAEGAIFGAFANLPGLTIAAETAARQIVRAIKREAAELIWFPTSVQVRLHGLFPGLVADAMGLATRLLPHADGANPGANDGASASATPSREVQERLHSPLLDFVTSLGRDAAQRLNQNVDITDGGVEREASS
jgi:NAD(P)-dependent dehydrogenase (short-subunit alcohol dehydrogenase family)